MTRVLTLKDEPNPYDPPRQVTTDGTAKIDYRRAARVAAVWVIGASTYVGVATTLRTCWALQPFAGIERAVNIMTISAFRMTGASISSSAVALGVFAGVHDRVARNRNSGVGGSALANMAAAPFLAPFLSGWVTALAVLVTSVGFDVPMTGSWERALTVLLPSDLMVGVTKAAVFAVIAAVILAAVGPWLARREWRFIFKLGVLLILVRAASGVIDFAVEAPVFDVR